MVEWKNVRLSKDLADELERFIESKTGKDHGFNSQADFVAAAVREALVRYKLRPRFQHINTYENHVKILDNDLEAHGRLISIYFNGDHKSAWCDYCEKTDCVHIDYVWELSEVAEVLRVRGLKSPAEKKSLKKLKRSNSEIE